MRNLSRIFLAACLAASFVSASFAETTPEALALIQKMASLYEGGPYRMSYEMEANVHQMGQTMTLDAVGSLIQHGRTKMKMDMDMKMSMPGGGEIHPGMPGEMEMSMKMIADGEILWTEMQMPMMPGKQVMKMRIDQMEQLAGKAGMPMGGQGMDPLSQIEKAAEVLDFAVVGTEGNVVTLEAAMTEEAVDMIAGSADTKALGNLEDLRYQIDVDKSTGRPLAVRMGGDPMIMSMRFKEFEYLDDVPEGTFSYTPPEGTQVMDLGAMFGAGGR